MSCGTRIGFCGKRSARSGIGGALEALNSQL
jgi:hypothetical protein